MEKSKLITALKGLKSTEYRLFCEFVHSPFFNKHEKLRLFCDILMDAAPQFKASDIERETVYRQVFPGEPYKYQKLSDLMTYLHRLLEQFMAQLQYEQDDKTQDSYLLEAFRERKLGKHFRRQLKKSSKQVGATHSASEEQFLHAYIIETESDQYFTQQESRTKDKSIERKTQNLDLFYFTAKLRNCCEMINRQNIINEQYDIMYLEETQAYIKKHFASLSTFPPIAIYYEILMTLTHSEVEDHYHHLTQLLQQHSSHFAQEELRTLYDYAQNYCIKKINSGKSNYLNEIFKLYQQLLSNGVIFENEQLSQWDYKNIVTVGTRLEEYGWTEEFVNEYKARLDDEVRENAYAYNLASLYYSQERYDQAMQLLQSVEFTDVYYSLGARSLMLKVYYESDEIEPLYSLFDSFKIYLRRNKVVSEYQYKVHMNLIRMVKRMTDIKLRANTSRKETIQRDVMQLKKRIENASAITNINWLVGQLDQLEAA